MRNSASASSSALAQRARTCSGVYVVRGDSVTWRPAVDAGRIALTLGLALCGAAALVGWAAVTRRS